MEIGNVNQGGQPILPLNVDNPRSTTNTQGTSQETIVLKDGAKAHQYIDNKNLTNKDVEKAVDKLNKLLEDKETYAEYEVYGKFKDLTVRIIDKNTKEVVQEIPPKKIIAMVEKLCELAGMFVDEKV